jgi:peptide methionine sulfoxide reductase MsrB
MTDALLTIPNHAPQAGTLPHFKADYLGYFDSGQRQLVFAFRRDLWSANLYISTCGWGQACATIQGVKIPANMAFLADEAQWLRACWNAASLRFGRTALENLLERQVFGFFPPATTGQLNSATLPAPASQVIQ